MNQETHRLAIGCMGLGGGWNEKTYDKNHITQAEKVIETAIEQGRFFDFFPDHVNYFSQATLTSAIERMGFTILSVRRTLGHEFNTVVARKNDSVEIAGESDWPTSKSDLSSLREAVPKTISALGGLLDDCRRRRLRVAAWGSGGKGLATFAAAGISPDDGIEYVVDSDPRKHFLYMPVSHFQVYPPDRLTYDPVDVILITALAHIGEIVDVIRNELGFGGEIYALGTEIRAIGKSENELTDEK